MSYKRTAAGAPPPGYSYLSPILSALESELRAKVSESHEGKRKTEGGWPIIQINHQRTRYVYDMYAVHGRISRELYDWCVRAKVVDANLIGKWKKAGYEKLCSTYVVNTTNYKFGGVSICRVPKKQLSRDQQGEEIQDPNSGCLGCASEDGRSNIFGNKYGQRLAAIQIAREKRNEGKAKEEAEEKKAQAVAGDSETDDDTCCSDLASHLCVRSTDSLRPSPVSPYEGSSSSGMMMSDPYAFWATIVDSGVRGTIVPSR